MATVTDNSKRKKESRKSRDDPRNARQDASIENNENKSSQIENERETEDIDIENQINKANQQLTHEFLEENKTSQDIDQGIITSNNIFKAKRKIDALQKELTQAKSTKRRKLIKPQLSKLQNAVHKWLHQHDEKTKMKRRLTEIDLDVEEDSTPAAKKRKLEDGSKGSNTESISTQDDELQNQDTAQKIVNELMDEMSILTNKVQDLEQMTRQNNKDTFKSRANEETHFSVLQQQESMI